MVSEQSVHSQLKRLNFNVHAWGKGEVNELPHILMPDEIIYEAVNGTYEAGFALLVATNFRVLLIDKKPLNYLTVEDLRFDMINEIDYSHRLMGAYITISTGSKTLRFRSYNQPRLRKLIGQVQHCMADAKQRQSQHAEGQNQHLQQINQQLQAYLIAQFQNQQELSRRLQETKDSQAAKAAEMPIVKPVPELADYLYAQGLLRRYQEASQKPLTVPVPVQPQLDKHVASNNSLYDELYAEGVKEIYGNRIKPNQPISSPSVSQTGRPIEINPIKIAYSKLPMALRTRRFSGLPATQAVPSPLRQVSPTQAASLT